MVMFAMNEKNVTDMMRHKLQIVGSDGLYSECPHPRVAGTYPRYFGKYIFKEKIINICEAVKHTSVIPFEKLGISNRGCLKKDYIADITVIDKDRYKEKNNYKKPLEYPEGVELVIINGKVSVIKDKIVNTENGSLL